MSEPTPRLSIVVPAHDERASLTQLAHRLRDVLDREGWSFELIVVDDGSRDGSAVRPVKTITGHSRWVCRARS